MDDVPNRHERMTVSRFLDRGELFGGWFFVERLAV